MKEGIELSTLIQTLYKSEDSGDARIGRKLTVNLPISPPIANPYAVPAARLTHPSFLSLTSKPYVIFIIVADIQLRITVYHQN